MLLSFFAYCYDAIMHKIGVLVKSFKDLFEANRPILETNKDKVSRLLAVEIALLLDVYWERRFGGIRAYSAGGFLRGAVALWRSGPVQKDC